MPWRLQPNGDMKYEPGPIREQLPPVDPWAAEDTQRAELYGREDSRFHFTASMYNFDHTRR